MTADLAPSTASHIKAKVTRVGKEVAFAYASRHDVCCMRRRYDRAVADKLASTPAVDLVRNPRLIDALESLNVTVRGR